MEIELSQRFWIIKTGGGMMEEYSFKIIAEMLDLETVNILRQCSSILNDSKDEKRKDLGESMEYMINECLSLKSQLEELDKIGNAILEIIGDSKINHKIIRR